MGCAQTCGHPVELQWVGRDNSHQPEKQKAGKAGFLRGA
jgi:hypothetical protein